MNHILYLAALVCLGSLGCKVDEPKAADTLTRIEAKSSLSPVPPPPPLVAGIDFYLAMLKKDNAEEVRVLEGHPLTPEIQHELLELYPKSETCSQKRNVVLLMSESKEATANNVFLDYLSCPPGGDWEDLAHASVLTHVGAQYDRFGRYMRERRLLWQDVNQVLGANGKLPHDLSLLEPPAPTEKLQGSADERILEAAKTGNLIEIKRAIGDGANIDARGQNDSTPLMLAFIYGHVRAAEILFTAGADASATRPKTGDGVLSFAASRVTRAWIDNLVASGADVQGHSALSAAIKASNIEAFDALLDNGAKIGKARALLLFVATRNGTPMAVAHLLDLGLDVNTRFDTGDTPLIEGAEDYEMVTLLLKRKARVDDRRGVRTADWRVPSMAPPRTGMTALARAVHGGHLESALLLLRAGANPNLLIPGYTFQPTLDSGKETEVVPVQSILELANDSKRSQEMKALLLAHGAKAKSSKRKHPTK